MSKRCWRAAAALPASPGTGPMRQVGSLGAGGPLPPWRPLVWVQDNLGLRDAQLYTPPPRLPHQLLALLSGRQTCCRHSGVGSPMDCHPRASHRESGMCPSRPCQLSEPPSVTLRVSHDPGASASFHKGGLSGLSQPRQLSKQGPQRLT